LLEIGSVETHSYSKLETDRIKCHIADQRSYPQIKDAINYFKNNEFDYILDDGHHYQEHQQKSLGILFKYLKSGGLYIIEDVSDYNVLKSGKYWGQSTADATDSTHYIFEEYLKNNILDSIYISEEELDYLNDNIKDVKIYKCATDILIIIEKK
jgi:hypothetical protein